MVKTFNKVFQRLQRISSDYEAISKAAFDDEVSLVSVDVFDTLLLRDTKPEIVRFLDIAALWKDHLAGVYSGTIKDLFYLRYVGARLAYRHATKVNDCREADYKAILRSVMRGASIPESFQDTLFMLELDYEKKSLKPNSKLISILEMCRHSGKRIIAISDMYYSSGDIFALIDQHVPAGLIQKVYSSSEYGFGKSSGLLYEAVKEDEKVEQYNGWVHCGDNYDSDVSKAKILGINAFYLPRPMIWRLVIRIRNIVSKIRLDINYL